MLNLLKPVQLCALFILASTSAFAGTALQNFRDFLANHPDATAKEVCVSLRKNIHRVPDMFADSTVNEAPKGDTYGCVIGLDRLSVTQSRLVGFALNKVWSGKKFNDEGTALVNKIPVLKPVGKEESATAQVYRTQSHVDGKDIYVLDYSQSEQNFPIEEKLIRIVRDEIREAAPGIYMGPVLLEIKGSSVPTSLYFAVFTEKSGLAH